jgi:SNF2 family DNA or RNA helicase
MSTRKKKIMKYKFKTEPYAHQLKALELSWDKPYFAYFMEMGTGKSKVLIDNIAMLYDAGKINGVLIVAPKGVYKNWYDSEIPTHMPEHVEYEDCLWQSLINQKQQKELDKVFKPGEDLHILIMNVEAFSTKKGVEFAAKFLRCHRTMMAIDESTTIKNPDAKRTKHICSLGEYAQYRRILTGSPVTKSPLDLYKQCEFLKKELLGHTSYYTFRTRYAKMKTANFGGRSVQIVTGYQHLGELSEKLKAFSYRVLKDDCLDLPAKTFIKRMVQLTPDQTKLYKQMKVLALAQMDGKIMTTATVLTQLMRLQQITCGHFTADDGTIKEVDSNRLPELMNVLEEIEGKVVIWAHWQRDVHRIIREISKKFGENSFVDYYGLTPMSERQKNIEKFQDPNSPVKYFIGTTQTGGYGITLTAASNMIYYSNGYDLEKRQQSEARIDRIGQHYPMTYIDIMCEHTVDERIVKALKKKVDIASQIMGEELKDWI